MGLYGFKIGALGVQYLLDKKECSFFKLLIVLYSCGSWNLTMADIILNQLDIYK